MHESVYEDAGLVCVSVLPVGIGFTYYFCVCVFYFFKGGGGLLLFHFFHIVISGHFVYFLAFEALVMF